MYSWVSAVSRHRLEGMRSLLQTAWRLFKGLGACARLMLFSFNQGAEWNGSHAAVCSHKHSSLAVQGGRRNQTPSLHLLHLCVSLSQTFLEPQFSQLKCPPFCVFHGPQDCEIYASAVNLEYCPHLGCMHSLTPRGCTFFMVFSPLARQ